MHTSCSSLFNLPFFQPKWDELYSYLSSPAGFQVALYGYDFDVWLPEQKKQFHLSFIQVCDDEGCHERHMPAEFYAVSQLL